MKCSCYLKQSKIGAFLGGLARLCTPNAAGLGLIPGQGTRSHTLQLGVHVLQLKIHVPQLRPQLRPSEVK